MRISNSQLYLLIRSYRGVEEIGIIRLFQEEKMKETILCVLSQTNDAERSLVAALEGFVNYEILASKQVAGFSRSQWSRAKMVIFFPGIKPGEEGNADPGQLIKSLPVRELPILAVVHMESTSGEVMERLLEWGVKDVLDVTTPISLLKSKIEVLLRAKQKDDRIRQLESEIDQRRRGTENAQEDFSGISQLMADSKDWDFLCRVVSQSGPIHRQKVNIWLLRVMAFLLSKFSAHFQKNISPYALGALDVNEAVDRYVSRIHPLGDRHPHHEMKLNIPVQLPTRILNAIYSEDSLNYARTISAIFEGPPHEVVMNMILMHGFEQFLDFLEGEKNE